MLTGAVQGLDLRLYDAAVSTAAPPPLAEITLVAVDDASLAALGSWPWPRDLHARLIDQLTAAGAKTIAFTPSLAGASPNPGLAHIRRIREVLAQADAGTPVRADGLARVLDEAEAALNPDARLAASIQRSGKVLLGYRPTAPGAGVPLPSYVHRDAVASAGGLAVRNASGNLYPLAAFGAAAAGTGHVGAVSDGDGTVRQVPLLLRQDQAVLPSLALLVARHSLHLAAGELQVADADGMRLGGLQVASDSFGVLRPRFPAAASQTPWKLVSFDKVLQGAAPADAFRNKIVLVGEMSDALLPRHAAPGQGLYPVELLAHTVSAIRQGQAVVRPAWAGAAAGAAAFAALLWVALALPRLPRAAGPVFSALLAVALAAAAWALLRYTGLWLPLAAAAVALLAGAAAHAGLSALQRRHGAHQGTTAEAAEADRMMGLALQGQGALDRAFEHLRKVPPSEALLGNLYHLGQDFERQHNPAQAKAVYKHILHFQRDYRDVRSRYKRVRALLGAGAAAAAAPPPASRQAPRLPGDAGTGMPMLGRYQVDRELGKGAMGVVYLGRDPKIGRVVAIKTLALSAEFEGDALVDARMRFFREAETAGRLQHPGIVTIFDAGEEHDLAYIAMEFLKGADLGQATRAGQLLPVATVLSIGARVADALDYAHAHQVVHRDIKPANIMYDSASDAVKVTDFGIARITDSSKTRTGIVLGTPSFMSPEQLAGKRVDGRSDLYSLGVTLYQLLAGALPLRGETMTELMHRIAHVDAPDIRQLRPELPAEVARILARALHKRPEARYQTGRQFAGDLRQAVAEAGQKGAVQVGAVVYDALRDAKAHEMVDFRTIAMEPSAGRGAVSNPEPGAR